MKYTLLLTACCLSMSMTAFANVNRHIEEVTSISQLEIGDRICITHYNKNNGNERMIFENFGAISAGVKFKPSLCLRGENSYHWQLVKIPKKSGYYDYSGSYAIQNVKSKNYMSVGLYELDNPSLSKLSTTEYPNAFEYAISFFDITRDKSNHNGKIGASFVSVRYSKPINLQKEFSYVDAGIMLTASNNDVYINGTGVNPRVDFMKVYKVE
ncbi:hypothetical protein [Vibrio maritimus]|uniref:hypothetical protein n=1 Tax=Vibrio maritimus TaxID=990268 RepID=UPI001F3154BF|nr:hypothetical protein [Vibrio maritimus]